jgi:hypothetical protein
VDEDRASVELERFGIRVGSQECGAVIEISRGMPQCGQHQVQFLTVIAASAQRRGCFDGRISRWAGSPP